MKIAIIGSNGQLGIDLCRALNNVESISLTHNDIEITDMNSVKEVFSKCNPDTIINTAAYVRVDDCEDNPDKAFLVNALGVRNVAVWAREHGAKFVQISTDYVFGGDKVPRTTPYTEFDVPLPLNVYGKSKLAGENFVRHLHHKHFIIRASGLFGTTVSSGKGNNFIETIIRLGKERSELQVVDDQIFSPTYTKDLAGKIAQLISTDFYGVFHITNTGICSWYEFASKIIQISGLSARVIPITSDKYIQKAKRPQFSVLDHFHLRLLGMDNIRSWEEALADYMIERECS